VLFIFLPIDRFHTASFYDLATLLVTYGTSTLEVPLLETPKRLLTSVLGHTPASAILPICSGTSCQLPGSMVD
jgi:hypothetical protein